MEAQKRENDSIPWVLIVILFLVGLWPVALVILLTKLFGKDRQKEAPPLTAEQRPQHEKKQNRAARVTKSPVPKKSTAKRLKIFGSVLLAVGVVACWNPIDMMLWGGVETYYVADLLRALALAVGGGAMLGSGLSMDRSLLRYRQYLAVMGDREAMATEELARTLGISRRTVEKDLQKMLEKGYFGGQAYLNMELGYLFRNGSADAEWKRQQAAAKAAAEPPKAAEEGYSGILRAIRRANDEIADPALSAKIDRLEEIAGRIFQIVEAEPEKAERITTFFNYYLPTTQKLLASYAKFESAGIEGENLRQAKARIESTMDTIVKGFEYQLDELYRGDAMDVDQDIRVMETMLHRDTTTVEQDFGLENAGKKAQNDQQT